MSLAIGMAARIRARHRLARPWDHPVVAGAHVVSRTRDYSCGETQSVATCQCGWCSRVEVSEFAALDIAVADHWSDVIAAAAGVAA